MPKCPKCDKDIPTQVMYKGSVNADWTSYAFKCNHCEVDLEIPQIWKAVLLMLLGLPVILYLSFKISIMWAQILLLVSMVLFYIFLWNLTKVRLRVESDKQGVVP
jgi:hypothetical protein